MTKGRTTCPECLGYRRYFTEWSDAADANKEMAAMVTYRPEEPDGTVEIICQVCMGTGEIGTGPENDQGDIE